MKHFGPVQEDTSPQAAGVGGDDEEYAAVDDPFALGHEDDSSQAAGVDVGDVELPQDEDYVEFTKRAAKQTMSALDLDMDVPARPLTDRFDRSLFQEQGQTPVPGSSATLQKVGSSSAKGKDQCRSEESDEAVGTPASKRCQTGSSVAALISASFRRRWDRFSLRGEIPTSQPSPQCVNGTEVCATEIEDWSSASLTAQQLQAQRRQRPSPQGRMSNTIPLPPRRGDAPKVDRSR